MNPDQPFAVLLDTITPELHRQQKSLTAECCKALFFMVPRIRFERTTFPLGGGRSILLSYRGVVWGRGEAVGEPDG